VFLAMVGFFFLFLGVSLSFNSKKSIPPIRLNVKLFSQSLDTFFAPPVSKFCLTRCGKSAADFCDHCKGKFYPLGWAVIFAVFRFHIYFVYFNIWDTKQPTSKSAMSISILILQ